MNNLDKQYIDLLNAINEYGVVKEDRTGTGTRSIFGYTIRHNMQEGFPLLTTKKMFFNGIVTELLWFLQGRTDLRFLLENGCHIWTGDAYKVYDEDFDREHPAFSAPYPKRLTKAEFEEKIMNDDEFNKWYGDLGPIYGKQWRRWNGQVDDISGIGCYHDQIANLIHDLRTNPDSRRLMVTAWNPAELDSMTLPPCHYGFQVYTRELSQEERYRWYIEKYNKNLTRGSNQYDMDSIFDSLNIPKRAISLMWNQRSVDTFLGLPFNIASYGLLLELIAKAVNMVPDELIGNLGDTHLYLNHIEQAKEQIGRELSLDERRAMVTQEMFNQIYTAGDSSILTHSEIDQWDIPRIKTREPYPLPTLNINTEWWPTESGECGVGPIDAVAVFHPDNVHFYKSLLEEDLQLGNYQAHPHIKAPLSN